MLKFLQEYVLKTYVEINNRLEGMKIPGGGEVEKVLSEKERQSKEEYQGVAQKVVKKRNQM